MRLYVGFITYGKSTSKYLSYFLPSLKASISQEVKIVVVDNSDEEVNENSIYIKNNFPEIDLSWAGKNLGFAKAFNKMIRRSINDGARYFLALNPDMIFEPNFIEAMVRVMESDKKIGAVAPKILKWDFTNNRKTDQIDSLGLSLTREHRFFDEHQGEPDNPGLNTVHEVFGFTGAAALLNLAALEDVAYQEKSPLAPPCRGGESTEYFDELMFMYKEDCDLSYRLRLAGWKIVLAPQALAYHNRAVAAKGKTNLQIALNRRHKSRLVKKWSFLNQWILLLKLKNFPFSFGVKLATGWYQIKSLLFVSLFEPFLLKELVKLWRLRPEIKKRRERLRLDIEIKELEKFMYDI
ncbi:hypothetical protein A3H09_03105 [Candidatus Falkowbacteria bacterium RIFCSPLOWO2_12_FULL_45_13]|uniref:Glycosyltransferase 2-like domain-containing protein n=1 Tax=Candidatus Falkowbacteria bacterium RIFCSPLOWO2_12_FULL_45_13 TaxID=1797991 RepID=A0A1F5SZG0_9BACT|nr:MAG: hypothetical protein A3H09_03105 [Candidatus Falkowbacteria bacterium RIFCSPLOWO2_12_FULL_45_13]